MITPLMLLLSSINEELGHDHPVDLMYLNRNDRLLIANEAERLGLLVSDEDRILVDQDVLGNTVVSNYQIINDKAVTISIGTVMILNRLKECYKVYKKTNSLVVDNDEDEDLGTDAVILRLEGNPKYIYVYVYNLMENKNMDYGAKITKLVDLYNAIISHTCSDVNIDKVQFMMQRLELQSSLQFWERLIVADAMKHNAAIVQDFSKSDIEKIKTELKDLGFYGFVNPKKMYDAFASSRVNRKVTVNVDDSVIEFLRKVVKSGGASVA